MLFLNVGLLEKINELVYEVQAPDKTNDESIKRTKAIKTIGLYINYVFVKYTLLQIKYIFIQHGKHGESTLPTLNLPGESASSTTKPRPVKAIEKLEEYHLL